MLRVFALGTLLAFQACTSPEPRPGLTRERYIATYVELLRAVAAAPDTIAAADSATAVLQRRDVTEEELLDFARRRAEDPQYLSGVWLEIESRLRAPPDTAKEPEG